MDTPKQQVVTYINTFPSTRALFFKSGNECEFEHDGLRYLPLDFNKSNFRYGPRQYDEQAVDSEISISVHHKRCDYSHIIRNPGGEWQPFYNSYTGLMTIKDLSDDAIGPFINSLEVAFPLLDVLETVKSNPSWDIEDSTNPLQGWCVILHYAFLIPIDRTKSTRFLLIPHKTMHWKNNNNFRALYSKRATNRTITSVSNAFTKMQRYYNIHKSNF